METKLEYILTHYKKDYMIEFLDENPEVFDEAIQLIFSDKEPYNWRAAWLLGNYIKDNDPRMQNQIQNIINVIIDKKDNHQRELLKIILKLKLNENQEGHLFNISLNIWEDIDKKSAVRYIAFKLIVKISKKYPSLKNEIAFYTQNRYMETLSSGIRNSLNRMIKIL